MNHPILSQILNLQQIFEAGYISEPEFMFRKQQLIDRFTSTTGPHPTQLSPNNLSGGRVANIAYNGVNVPYVENADLSTLQRQKSSDLFTNDTNSFASAQKLMKQNMCSIANDDQHECNTFASMVATDHSSDSMFDSELAERPPMKSFHVGLPTPSAASVPPPTPFAMNNVHHSYDELCIDSFQTHQNTVSNQMLFPVSPNQFTTPMRSSQAAPQQMFTPAPVENFPIENQAWLIRTLPLLPANDQAMVLNILREQAHKLLNQETNNEVTCDLRYVDPSVCWQIYNFVMDRYRLQTSSSSSSFFCDLPSDDIADDWVLTQDAHKSTTYVDNMCLDEVPQSRGNKKRNHSPLGVEDTSTASCKRPCLRADSNSSLNSTMTAMTEQSSSATDKPPVSVQETENAYTCSVCGKECRDKNNMRKHFRKHSMENTYECNSCHKRFTHAQSLSEHMQVHSDVGVSSHECNICGKLLANDSNLRRHKRIHTGEKPYVCKICDRPFNQSGNLNIHLRKVHHIKNPNSR